MKSGVTRTLLIVALVATAIAAWFAPPVETNEVALSERTQKATMRATSAAPVVTDSTRGHGSRATSAPVEVLSIRPREQDGTDDSAELTLFTATRWAAPVQKVATPVATVAVAAPQPQVPPLPFRVMGSYKEADQTTVFLQHNDRSLVVRVGDTIAEQYKVESLNGSTLTLRYLPLDQTQSLEIGGAQ